MTVSQPRIQTSNLGKTFLHHPVCTKLEIPEKVTLDKEATDEKGIEYSKLFLLYWIIYI